MILRDRPNAIRLLLSLRGSILIDIWQPLTFSVVVAALVTWSGGHVFGYKIHLEVAPFSLIGITLALFLGFRNNVCYDRYWEGRRLWGELVLASRNLSRQMLTWVMPPAASAEATRRRMVYRVIAITHALRHELRNTRPETDLGPLVDPQELQAACAVRSPTNALLGEVTRDLRTCHRHGWLDTFLLPSIEEQVQSLSHVLAGCERIRNTPVPFAYMLLMHRTIFIYCVLLPFGLVDTCGAATPLISAILAYTFFGLDEVGSQIEEPFGMLPNDLPLTAICRTIEIDLRQMLGETEVPPPLAPVKSILS
jgi:putative membrane protein